MLQVGGGQHGAHRDGVDGLVLRHYTRIIRGSEPGRDVARGHGRVQRNGKEVKAVRGIQAAEDRRRFTGDECHGGDLAPAQLVERHLLVVVCRRHRYVQQLEKPRCGNRRARTAQIDVDPLICQIGDRFDVLPRKEVELFIIELGDIGRPVLDSREQVLLPRVIEHIGLENGHVDAAEQLQIGDVLQGSLADDRQDPPRRPVVYDICQILCDPHRDPGGARRLELDNTSVHANFRRMRTCGLRERRAGDRRSQDQDNRSRNRPTAHWILFPLSRIEAVQLTFGFDRAEVESAAVP